MIALLAPHDQVVAQIYRCETELGVVFSDTECGDDAELVELEDDSRGIMMGPPEDVRTELRATREQWAKDLAAQREALARAQPPPPVIIEGEVAAPVWGWRAPGYLRPPGHGPGYRPGPPHQPQPLPPVAPPIRPPQGPPNVMRPPR
jgi:hypothetical protein